jgi:DNA-binding transcriptional LysR family regulator
MMDVALLPAFVAVADTGSFTRAAAQLGVTQSTVSQQIRRLEASLGKPLFVRDTHAVALTSAGLILLGQAHTILACVHEVEMQLRSPDMLGKVRLGIAEDFASSQLPDILRRFRRVHAQVKVSIEIDMSRTLLDRLDRGLLDLALVKCHENDRRPETKILSEPLVWVALEERSPLAQERPLPLALHPEPSITRALVLDRLAASSIEAVVVHSANTLNGLRAGVAAGIGISAFGRNFIPAGLRILDRKILGLPELPALDFILARRREGLDEAGHMLANLIEKNVTALRACA